MGAICATCKTYQPITRNLTVDQKPARKAKDVIGHVLQCGHKFGNKEFMKINEIVNAINAEFANREEQLQEERSAAINAALAPLESKGRGK